MKRIIGFLLLIPYVLIASILQGILFIFQFFCEAAEEAFDQVFGLNK